MVEQLPGVATSSKGPSWIRGRRGNAHPNNRQGAEPTLEGRDDGKGEPQQLPVLAFVWRPHLPTMTGRR